MRMNATYETIGQGTHRWKLAAIPIGVSVALLVGQIAAAAAGAPRSATQTPALPVDGCFGANLITTASNGGSVLATGDFNRDGKVDAVVVGQTLGMMLGKGDGTFTPDGETALPPVVGGYGNVVAADFNNDGKLDAALAAESSVAILLGKGDGTFQPYRTTSVSNGASSIAVGDFDGDGHLDIAALANDRVSILLGAGDGSFAVQATTYPVHVYSPEIKAGDLNGDGKLDLATVSTQGYVSILLGDGTGAFPTTREYSATSAYNAHHLTLGDVNRDNRLDIVTDGGSGPAISVFLNQGNDANGVPAFTPTHYGDSIYTDGVTLADVNNDGNLDALVSGPFRSVLIGSGDGTFHAPTALVGGNTVYDINAAEINGDGRVDIVLAANNGVQVLLNSGCLTPSLKAVSTMQYTLSGSNGSAWKDIDTTSSTPLVLTVTPTVDSQAIVSGNADLFTEQAGYNQDLGISVSGGGTYPTVAGQPEAWKESGGFGGTFSPNAAYVQTVLHFTAGQTYTVKLQWKANRADAGTIVAGAGPIPNGPPGHSPTRLTVELVPAINGSVVTSASTTQFLLSGSNGTDWTDLGPGDPNLSFTPPANGMAILSGNADLWTENAGYNQDIGIYVSGGNGAYPTVAGQPEAWKESGGKAGTYSPNAAFVQAVLQLAAGQTYQARLQWKSNIGDPGTIVAGAGPIPDGPTTHSLTRLTLLFVPDSGNTTVIDRSTSEQKSLALSDGVTWTAMDSIGAGGGPLTAEFTAPADCLAVISGNADLFTNTAGYNQDIGISISGGDYPANPDQPIAWKESGGFAGTFSPNAAFVQTVIPVKSGVRYQAWLVWKTNIHTLWNGTPPVPAIYAGAGPIPNGPNGHSLTRLTVHLAACP